MNYIWHYPSPLGDITMAGNGEELTGLWFEGQKYFAATLGNDYHIAKLPVFERSMEWLDMYFGESVPDFTPPLALDATPFRKAVWRILLTIPYGQTMSYGEIARLLALQSGYANPSARAVGGAVGRNPISLIIPCHRVIGADGSLTGYAGGTDKKAWLLDMEQNLHAGLFNRQ